MDEARLLGKDELSTTTRLIFVCGARRAGTTLMAAVLSSAADGHDVLPEAQILTKLVETYEWAVSRQTHFVSPLVGDSAQLDRLYAGWLEQLVAAVRARNAASELLVLKHPAMLCVLGSFLRLYPKAEPVIMVRDPHDQVASELEVERKAGRHKTSVAQLAERLNAWFESVSLSGKIVVRYEDLVLDFQKTRERLQNLLGIEISFDPHANWDGFEQMRAFSKYPAWSPKYGQAIDSRGVGRGRRELSPASLATVEDACQRYISAFNYDELLT